MTTIREARDQAGIRQSQTEPDKVIDLQTAAASIESAPDVIVGHALLEAADMIRTVKIVLDAKDEVPRGE